MLAKKNKESRSALENQKKQEEPFLDLSNKIIYIASLGGAIFSLFQIYKFFYPNKKIKEETNEVEEEEEPEEKQQSGIDMD